jgi:hypothetical protein
VRELSNKLHSYDQDVVGPLRQEVASLRVANAKLTARNARLEQLEEAYRQYWEAHVRLAAAQLASGKEG